METITNTNVTSTAAKLESVLNELQEILGSFTDQEFNVVPFAGSWTAAQVGDHLLQSYGVAQTMTGNVFTTERPIDIHIPQLQYVFLNFDVKMESPSFILPSQEFINREDLLSAIKEKASLLCEIVRTKDLSETCVDFEMPMIGLMTRLEWAHFVICHTQRHIRQLKKIKKALQSR